MMDQLHSNLKVLRQQFDKVTQQADHLQLASSTLSDVAGLGAIISPDDVIDASAKMVAGGIDPHMIAGELAQMPQAGGEPLQAWLGQYMQQIQQAQAQLAPLVEVLRHHLGVSAMAVLTGDHMGAPSGVGGPPAPGPSNPLGPSPFPTPGESIEPPGRPQRPPMGDQPPTNALQPSNALEAGSQLG